MDEESISNYVREGGKGFCCFVSSSLKSRHHILFRVLFALPVLIRGGLTASIGRFMIIICFSTVTTYRHDFSGVTVTYDLGN